MAKCAIRLMRRTVGRTAGGGPSRFRRILARMRHDPDPDPDPDPDGDGYAVRGLAFTHPRGPVVLPHAEGWDQLIYAASGVMTVHTADGVWVVPPDRATGSRWAGVPPSARSTWPPAWPGCPRVAGASMSRRCCAS